MYNKNFIENKNEFVNFHKYINMIKFRNISHSKENNTFSPFLFLETAWKLGLSVSACPFEYFKT